MEPLAFDPQDFWDNLLSRQPELIQLAYNQLEAEEQKAVTAHLKRMAEDDGWHPEQVISARSALKVILSIASNPGE